MAKKYERDPEIESLLPKQTPEERAGLKLLIETDGHIDPLVLGRINKQLILLDGHNRDDIADELKIKAPTREITFPSRELAIQWVIDNQLARRNLTDQQRDYLQGKKRLQTKKPEGQPSQQEELCHFDTVLKSRDELAEEFGVSPATVERNAEFAKAVDAIAAVEGPQAREEILNGTSGKTKKEVIESAPILCDKCKRLGAQKNCKFCATLRREAKEKKPKPPPKETPPAPTLDPHGVEIPRHCKDAWCDPWIDTALSTLGAVAETLREARLADGLNKRKKHYPHFNVEDFILGVTLIDNNLDKLMEHLEAFRPAAVCPRCQGKRCPDCKHSGLVPEAVYVKLTEAQA